MADLGPLKTWGFELQKNQIVVDKITMQTNIPGVFAAGDICWYPAKFKLIATGAAEAVTAVNHAVIHNDPKARGSIPATRPTSWPRATPPARQAFPAFERVKGDVSVTTRFVRACARSWPSSRWRWLASALPPAPAARPGPMCSIRSAFPTACSGC